MQNLADEIGDNTPLTAEIKSALEDAERLGPGAMPGIAVRQALLAIKKLDARLIDLERRVGGL